MYWHEPYHAFKNGFKGFCSVFVTAAFAFAGTELVGLAAAEADNPRKSLPKATKQVFWRITLFYVVSLFILGLIVDSSDEQLSGASGANSKYSPFTRACVIAGIEVLPHIINAVITISVISVANSCTYGSTRTMQALALNGMAPSVFTKVDKHGRPWVALMVALGLGLLGYISLAPKGNEAFNWLLALSGLSSFFTWGSICLSHICFRRAWKLAGRNTDELPFTAMFGVAGSWIGFGLNVLCLIATFYNALYVSSPNANSPKASELTRCPARRFRHPRRQGLLLVLPRRVHRHRLLRGPQAVDAHVELRRQPVDDRRRRGPPRAQPQGRDGCGARRVRGAADLEEDRASRVLGRRHARF
jgi:amino acid transporter